MTSPAEQIATEVLRIINASPRTPSKAKLVDTIQTMLDVIKDDEIAPPPGTEVFPTRPGASIVVTPAMGLLVDGWNVTSPRPLTNQEGTLAILEWMRKGVLTAPRQ